MIKYRVIQVIDPITLTTKYKTERIIWKDLDYELFNTVEEAMQSITDYKKRIHKPLEYVIYEEGE